MIKNNINEIQETLIKSRLRDWPDDARQPAAFLCCSGANSCRTMVLTDERV
jgi:hypothetical protein